MTSNVLAKSDRDALLCEKISGLPRSCRRTIREHLSQLLESPVFRGTRRCQDLLRYVVEKSLDEKFDCLKERIIGMEAFGRPAEYDTSADSIVRVTANEVRKRLALFYMETSPNRLVRIELPAGSYIPEFHLSEERAQPKPVPEPEVVNPSPMEVWLEPPTAVAGDRTDTNPARARRGYKWLLAALVVVSLICLASNAWWWRQVQANRNGWGASDQELVRSLPWSGLLNGPEKPIYVVLADVAIGTSQELLGRALSLTDYMRNSFLDNPATTNKEALHLAQMMAQRPYTSATDAALAAQLLKLHPTLNRRSTVRFARHLRIEELTEGNAILFGAGYSNLWETLVKAPANFRIEYERSAGMHVCINRAPRPGELARYVPAGPTGTTGVAYAVVEFLPGPRKDGHVLLIAGTNTEGTQEAGDFVMNRERFTEALRKIGVDPYGPVRHFEILLKLNTVGGSSYQSEMIGHRVLPASSSL